MWGCDDNVVRVASAATLSTPTGDPLVNIALRYNADPVKIVHMEFTWPGRGRVFCDRYSDDVQLHEIAPRFERCDVIIATGIAVGHVPIKSISSGWNFLLHLKGDRSKGKRINC